MFARIEFKSEKRNPRVMNELGKYSKKLPREFVYSSNDDGFVEVEMDKYNHLFDELLELLETEQIAYDALEPRDQGDYSKKYYRPMTNENEDIHLELFVHPEYEEHYIMSTDIADIIEKQPNATLALNEIKKLIGDYTKVRQLPKIKDL